MIKKGRILNFDPRIPKLMYDRLKSYVTPMIEEFEDNVESYRNFGQNLSRFTHDVIINLIGRLEDKYNAILNEDSDDIASSFVEAVNKTAQNNVASNINNMLSSIGLKGRLIPKEITPAVNVGVKDNVALIKTIPEVYFSKIEKALHDSFDGGQGMFDFLPKMKEIGVVTERRATMIAFDQTRKLFNKISAEKMKSLGVTHFQWLHTGGSHQPRPLHVRMSGNIYEFDNPPFIGIMYGKDVKGLPGDLPNCGCKMIPIFKMS